MTEASSILIALRMTNALHLSREEHGAGFHDDEDVNVIVKYTYRLENRKLRGRDCGVETV